MKNFAEQVNQVVFINHTKEYDYTRNGAYIEAVTRINNIVLQKISKKLYLKFKSNFDYESFINEFQTQIWFASLAFATGKSTIILEQVLNDLQNDDVQASVTKQFLNYIMTTTKCKIYDQFIQTKVLLTDELKDDVYYDNYFTYVEEDATNQIKSWYFENKTDILTTSQLEFLKRLNTNTLTDSDKKNKARVIDCIKIRVKESYRKNFSL